MNEILKLSQEHLHPAHFANGAIQGKTGGKENGRQANKTVIDKR
jgi:hypothetical protein